ncbi:MAG: dienelactone hydrolase family protein [Oscillatoriales cyanobacterium]|nr:MAG: dienelactone hydrolase family protein [Oscillatoriales cyanobacterium]
MSLQSNPNFAPDSSLTAPDQGLAIHSETLTIPPIDPALGLPIRAYLARPIAQPAPVVVVLQEVFGVNAHIRSVCDRLAQAGYLAIAPALYQRTAPSFEVDYSAESLALGRHHKDLTTAETLLADIRAAIAYARALPGAIGSGVGCLGFCFGGHVAYLAATLPEVTATAAFYGAGITTFCPGGGPPTVSRTSQIHGKLWFFVGLADPLIPIAQIEALEAALTEWESDYCLWRYPDADHGFFCDVRASYHPEAATDAWQRVQALFATLRPPAP